MGSMHMGSIGIFIRLALRALHCGGCGVAVTVDFLWEAVNDVTFVTSFTAYFFISVPDYTKAARAMATEQ